MVWINRDGFRGWGCSDCEWNYAIPTLLSDPEAKSAFDRLAASKFREHQCSAFLSRLKSSEPPSFTERMRKLVRQGFKPKDAVEIVMQEVQLEYRDNPKVLAQAKSDAEDFLRRVRDGVI
jgi:hypothetical protein